MPCIIIISFYVKTKYYLSFKNIRTFIIILVNKQIIVIK